MYKKSLLFLSIFTFNISTLSAIECSQKIYAPALDKIPNTLDLVSQAAIKFQTLQSLRQISITKESYENAIKILKEKLKLLEQKKEFALEAKKLNDENIKLWDSLAQSCQGANKTAAKKVQNNLQEIEQLINKRLSTIEHYKKLTQNKIEEAQNKYTLTTENNQSN